MSYLIRERVSAEESIADCQQVLKRQRLQLSRRQTLTDEDMEWVIHSFHDLVEQNLKVIQLLLLPPEAVGRTVQAMLRSVSLPQLEICLMVYKHTLLYIPGQRWPELC